jgi:N-acetylglucosamine-6-phosphate deacetylase
MGNLFTTFTNCRLCINGEIVEGERLVVSQDDGLILKSTGYIGGEIVDLDDAIIAPGLLDLHADGLGPHRFSEAESPSQLRAQLEADARQYPAQGVTCFWAAVATDELKYDEVA